MSNRSLLRAGTVLTQGAVRKLIRNVAFGDSGSAMHTFDQATLDATGAFLTSELLRLDQRDYLPLVQTFWKRDIDLRSDVTMGDEQSGFINTGWAAAGGVNPSGINWASQNANALPRVQLDAGLTTKPLRPWTLGVEYTVFDLANAQRIGRPIDATQVDAMEQKWDMDVDQMVAIGDTGVSAYGMYNNPAVTPYNVDAGASGSLAWSTKTPSEILNDVNTLLNAVWVASAVAQVPEDLRLPTLQFGYIASTPVSTAGTMSILEYVATNCISYAANGQKLRIFPSKWLDGLGASSSDRMAAYTRRENFIRYPLVPKSMTPVQYRGIWQSSTYFGRLGEIELVYPGTVGYADGI